jgi:3-hydroxybutyryl-CoA dehydratase
MAIGPALPDTRLCWAQMPRDAVAFKTYTFEELTVGMRDSLLRTVMASTVNQFAEVSGDANPIHLSDDFAAGTRFGQRIAHGMFTASLISAVIGTRLPGPGAVYLSQTLRFLAPVRIGDVVGAVVEVAEMVEKGRRVRLDCHCLVDGKAVLEGEAWVMVPGAVRRT